MRACRVALPLVLAAAAATFWGAAQVNAGVSGADQGLEVSTSGRVGTVGIGSPASKARAQLGHPDIDSVRAGTGQIVAGRRWFRIEGGLAVSFWTSDRRDHLGALHPGDAVRRLQRLFPRAVYSELACGEALVRRYLISRSTAAQVVVLVNATRVVAIAVGRPSDGKQC